MKRPIPEGVRPPKSTVVILGWGTEFNVPGRFMGWAMQPDAKAKEDRQWCWGEYDGIHHKWIYAADAGSEVARLNACPDPNCTAGRTFVTDLEGQPKQIQCGCEEDPRDGAIRALVQKWREEADIRSNGNAALAMMECADELEAAIDKQPESTLERTEAEIREFITDALKTPLLERR